MSAVINPISANQDLDPQTPVPFGKYKGRPVIEMMADTNYVSWLMAQGWFAEKYQVVFNIITGYNGDVSETPEHNSLQVKFLEPEVWATILKTPSILARLEAQWKEELLWEEDRLKFELGRAEGALGDKHASDAERQAAHDKAYKVKSALAEFKKVYPSLVDGFHDQQMSVNIERVEFEKSGCDAFGFINTSIETAHFTWRLTLVIAVEIKPNLSDDYPAVLRQMRAMRLRLGNEGDLGEYVWFLTTLYTQRVSAKGATPDQIRRIFESSGFTLVIDPPIEGGVCDQ
jgi:uncharacterized protein (DUF3820 family)